MTRSLGHGGTERQVAEIAKSIDRTRFSPHVACFDPGGFREAELRECGVPILQMDMHSFFSLDSLRAAARLRSYAQTHGIRLVHTFDHPMNVFGVPAARVAGVPIVLSSQRSHRDLIPSKYLPMIRLSDRLVNGIVVNCNFVRDHLEHDYHVPARKIRVCYNALDTSRFHPSPRLRPPELADATCVIGVVCVLRDIKGVDTLVDAFSRACRDRPGLRLLIVGSGPERHGLERKSQELGIAGACCFRDSTSNVLPWLHAIDVFVLPSRSEALSNSLMEAMASGCCAVASRVGGNPELVHDGDTGLLFESGNAAALAAQLKSLIDDPERRARLAGAGTQFIAANFCTARSIRCMENVYTGFLSK